MIDHRRHDGPFPAVSAILPTHNAAAFVSRAIDSVLGQEGGHAIELIVVDDRSTDGTAELIKQRYGSDSRVVPIVSECNGGPGAARNQGLARARGHWIGLIDADDAWTADRVSALLPLCTADIDILFDNIISYDQVAGMRTGLLFPSLPQPMTVAAMALDPAPGSKFNFGYLKPLIRSDFLRRTGVKYPAMRISEDLLFYLELLINGARAKTTDQGFYTYTTKVGLLSGRSSAISATIPDDALVSEQLDKLAARYRDCLNADELDSILSRADRLRRLAPVNRLYHNWTARRYLAVAQQCLADRSARQQLVRALSKRLLPRR